MSDAINEIKVLLTALKGEFLVSEEKIKNKLDKTQHLEDIQALKDTLEDDIEAVDKRINSLYLKVAGFSGIIVAILEILIRSVT